MIHGRERLLSRQSTSVGISRMKDESEKRRDDLDAAIRTVLESPSSCGS